MSERLEAALFAIDGRGGARMLGRTKDPRAIEAARDAIARQVQGQIAEIERIQQRPLCVVPDPEGAA